MTSHLKTEGQFDLGAFIQKDYELKITYFTNHLTRMWTRFGMFVTLETALVAVLIVQGSLSSVAPQIAAVQAGISAIWFVLGRHDLCLIRIYRDHIVDVADALREHGVPEEYVDVINVNSTGTRDDRRRVLERKNASPVPIMPALLPLGLTVAWAGLAIGLGVWVSTH